MSSVTSRELRADLADTLNRVIYRGERVLIERRGKAVAAIVPMEDYEAIEAKEEAADAADHAAAMAEARQEGTKPLRTWAAERAAVIDGIPR
jgi:prevent-host-death family protein